MAMPQLLSHHVLIRDHFCLALSVMPGVEEKSESPVAPSEISNASFILPEQAFGTFQVASRGGFTPHIVSTPGSLLAVLTQVSIGNGISIIPSALRSVVNLPGVVFRDIAGEPIVSEIAAIFRSDEVAPAVRHLISQIQRTIV